MLVMSTNVIYHLASAALIVTSNEASEQFSSITRYFTSDLDVVGNEPVRAVYFR